jgi:mRNA-degrading endonuclease RelE of RelBE toxin-antitoxin system
MPYRIVYARETEEHFKTLTARQRSTVLQRVEKQLVHEPAVETRNRKPMRENPLATWELRVENIRVYYDIVEQPEPTVEILAIGVKRRDRIWIGGIEVEL